MFKPITNYFYCIPIKFIWKHYFLKQIFFKKWYLNFHSKIPLLRHIFIKQNSMSPILLELKLKQIFLIFYATIRKLFYILLLLAFQRINDSFFFILRSSPFIIIIFYRMCYFLVRIILNWIQVIQIPYPRFHHL